MVPKRLLLPLFCVGLFIGGGRLDLSPTCAEGLSGGVMGRGCWHWSAAGTGEDGSLQEPGSADMTATATSSPTPTGTLVSLPTNSCTPASAPTTTVTWTGSYSCTLTPTRLSTTPPSPTSTFTPVPTCSQTATATSTVTPTLSPSPTSTHILAPTAISASDPLAGSVVINEVFYDAPSEWSEPEDEWFELYNNTDRGIDLGDWTVEDNSGQFAFVEGTVILGYGYLVLAYDGLSFESRWGFAPITYGSAAGNLKLSNSGDRLILKGAEGTVVDQMSYGDDASVLDPPCQDVAPGHSLERDPAGFDSDQALDFVERESPSPGEAPLPTPTATATLTPVATATPAPPLTPSPSPTAAPLLISEVCYDGTTPGTEGDEFLELHNPLSATVSLAGYKVGDEEAQGGGEGMYRLPITATIGPGQVLLIAKNAAQFHDRFGQWPDFEAKASGSGYEDTPAVENLEAYTEWAGGFWALANDGDEMLLLGPGDELVDAVIFESGDGKAVGVNGTLSSTEPRSLQRVLGPDTDDMPSDFAIAEPNPGQLTRVPLLPDQPPPSGDLGGGMHAYWGCLHSHSTYSDGSGPPRYAYAVGRANGLHFLALTDHSHMHDARQWADLEVQAAGATEDGAFVALRGFEWTSREEGHITVYNTAGFVSRDNAPYDTLTGFYAWLTDQEGAIGQFNHPFPGNFADFAYEEAVDRRISLLEVGNGSGAEYRRFEESYLHALGAGWHVGPANNGDTDTPDWGADTLHRTGIVACALTQRDLLDALRARRTFATEDPNLALALRTGNAWMGDILPSSGDFELTVIYADADGESAKVALYDRTLLIETTSLSSNASWSTIVSAVPGHFYWARAEQADGDLAYTSPVWVAGQASPDAVFVNEFCPAPHDVDWDGSGQAGADDEWVELYNAENHAVGLGGWQLDDEAQGGSSSWTFPLGQAIPSRGYLVLFKRDTGLALNDGGDSVRLLCPDGSVADEVAYTRSPGYDRTWSRTEDGGGEWTRDYEPTMGEANKYERKERPPEKKPAVPAIPQRVTLAQARALPSATTVLVEGQVTAPPGVFGTAIIYIQDAATGLKVYLSGGSYPPLAEGDWVQVEGKLSEYYGERELRVSSGAGVQWLRAGTPLEPISISTGELSEACEGRLAEIVGRVTGWGWDVIYLDDGSGEAQVYFGRSELVKKPWVEKGELYLVVGVVSQYASAKPYEGGYRLLPRYEQDIVPAPLELPITGSNLPSGIRQL